MILAFNQACPAGVLRWPPAPYLQGDIMCLSQYVCTWAQQDEWSSFPCHLELLMKYASGNVTKLIQIDLKDQHLQYFSAWKAAQHSQ